MRRVGLYVVGKLRDRCVVTTLWANDPLFRVTALRSRRVWIRPPTNFPSSLAVKLAWSQSIHSSPYGMFERRRNGANLLAARAMVGVGPSSKTRFRASPDKKVSPRDLIVLAPSLPWVATWYTLVSRLRK